MDECVEAKKNRVDPAIIKGLEEQCRVFDDVETAKKKVILFSTLHMGMSCLHPNTDPYQWPPPYGQIPFQPLTNPLRIDLEEVLITDKDILENYERFINLCQSHKCKHHYCLQNLGKHKKGLNASEKDVDPKAQILDGQVFICRFGFPMDICGFDIETEQGKNTSFYKKISKSETYCLGAEIISDDSKTITESLGTKRRKLQMARNHPLLNSHIKSVGFGWGANTDCQIILSPRQAAAYINKYVMKAETNTNAHKKVMRSAAHKINDNASMRGALQSVIIQSTTREICVQEAFLMLSLDHELVSYSLPMRLCSLSGNKLLNLDVTDPNAKAVNDSGWQYVYWKREKDEKYHEAVKRHESNPDAWNSQAKKTLPNYCSPKHPKDVSLHEFLSFFKKDWTFGRKEHFPVFSPSFKVAVKPKNKELYELSCRARILQFKPGSTPNNILEGFQNHEACLKDFVDNSTSCPKLLKDEFEDAQLSKVLTEKGPKGDGDNKGDGGKEEETTNDELNDNDSFPDLFPDLEGIAILLY